MEAKEAIAAAKAYLEELFGPELMSPPRLEEIWFDESDKAWCVTFGFFRKPDEVLKTTGRYSTYVYKVVRLTKATGTPVSIKDRDRVAA